MISYVNGLDMNQFKRIEGVSLYNYNYYNGFLYDLLFAESDDDNRTTWYIVKHTSFVLLGYSYCSENNRLHVHTEHLT